MTRSLLPVAVSVLVLGGAACSTRAGVYRAMYHGLQVREELVTPSAVPGVAKDRPPAHSEYEAERQRILEQRPAR